MQTEKTELLFHYTYTSKLQFSGFSIRYPSLSNLNKSLFGIPGYGLPPKVTISHNTIPNDQLEINV